MSKKTRYLVLRYNTYFAELTVPDDVRHIIKKSKFSRTTGTGDTKAAQAVANLFVLKWKAEIAQARAKANDPIINSALELNKLLKSQDNTADIKEIIDEEELRLRIQTGSDAAADAFKAIALGKQKYLKNLLPDWKRQQERKRLATKTIDQMESDLELLLESLPTVSQLSAKNVAIWIEYLGTHGNLTPSSINRIVGSGRSFFKYLQEIGEADSATLTPFVVPAKYKISSKPNSKSANKQISWQPYSEDDVVTLYEAALEIGDELMAHLIFVAAYTGARIEEICSLKCSDVNIEKKFITISSSKTEAGRREIPIHSKLLPVLKKLMKLSKDGYVLSGLTLNKYGDRSNAIGKRFGRLKTELGFGKQHVFHSIRKTLVTKLENAGVSENLAADIVGHEKPRITYGLYSGGATLEVKREALQKISYAF